MWYKRSLKSILFESATLNLDDWEFKRERDEYWDSNSWGDGWIQTFTNKETGEVVEEGDSQFGTLSDLQKQQWDQENAERRARVKKAPKKAPKPDRGPRYRRRSDREEPVDTALDDKNDMTFPFSLQNPVGSENAGRVGGMIGSRLFRQFVNFSVTNVTTRGGDTSPDISLRVYDGVALDEKVFHPSPKPGEDKYMYRTVGDGIQHYCEIGFEGKEIYMGRWLLNSAGIPRWQWNSNLTPMGRKLAESALGPEPALTHFGWRPTTRIQQRLQQLNSQYWTPFLFQELQDRKPLSKEQMVKIFQATSDSYFMKLDRTTRSARICRAGFEEMEYGITGHTERAEFLARDKNKSGFKWAALLDPDEDKSEAKLSQRDRTADMFKHREIPTISDIASRGMANIGWGGRQNQINLKFDWDNWNWDLCPELTFLNDAMSILADAIVERNPELEQGMF